MESLVKLYEQFNNMKKLVILFGVLALSWTASAQTPLTVQATETTITTNIVTTAPIPGDRTATIGPRQLVTTRVQTTVPTERHTLTFVWRGKTFNIVDDVPSPAIVVYQRASWTNDPALTPVR